MTTPGEDDLPDDARVCNCAECGRLLLATLEPLGFTRDPKLPPRVAGRVLGRPYCAACLAVRKPPGRAATADDDAGPWQSKAIREMEDNP